MHVLLSKVGPYKLFSWDIERTGPNKELESEVSLFHYCMKLSLSIPCTFKSKGSLLAPVVSQINFIIHRTFTLHKRFFTVEKDSLDH